MHNNVTPLGCTIVCVGQSRTARVTENFWLYLRKYDERYIQSVFAKALPDDLSDLIQHT